MTIAPDIAAIRRNFEILKVLCDGAQDTAFSSRARNEAAELGQLGIVQYLHERNAPCTCQAMDLASANGHLDVVKFLHGNRTEGCSQYAKYWASKNGHADVVRYLTGALVSIDNCVAVASTQGHSDVVAILESKRAVYERKYGLQWSSAARARRRRLQHQHLLVNPGPSRVVLHELEKEFLSI